MCVDSAQTAHLLINVIGVYEYLVKPYGVSVFSQTTLYGFISSVTLLPWFLRHCDYLRLKSDDIAPRLRPLSIGWKQTCTQTRPETLTRLEQRSTNLPDGLPITAPQCYPQFIKDSIKDSPGVEPLFIEATVEISYDVR